MEKRTLLFTSLEDLAKFSKVVSVGYLMNTTNLSLTGYFSAEDIFIALKQYSAKEIKTTEKVYSYNRL
jgi:hypothetical protein